MNSNEFYNKASQKYDSDMDTAPARRLRQHVQDLLERHAPGVGAVLDFGCGTGLDAAAFAARGRRVLAYDPSEGMLARLRERCAEEILQHRIVPVGGGMAELHATLAGFEPVHAMVANFAVLNLLPDLAPFAELATRRLSALQAVILCVQNPFYLPDIRAGWWWRGLMKGWRAGVIHCDVAAVPTRRYFSATLADTFAPGFELRESLGPWAAMRLLVYQRRRGSSNTARRGAGPAA